MSKLVLDSRVNLHPFRKSTICFSSQNNFGKGSIHEHFQDYSFNESFLYPKNYLPRNNKTARLEIITTVFRETGVSRHNGGLIKGPPLNPSIPQSAVMVRGFPGTLKQCLKRRHRLGKLYSLIGVVLLSGAEHQFFRQ